MPDSHLITALQWAITFSGVLVCILSLRSTHSALNERAAITAQGLNGGLAASAKLHFYQSLARLTFGAISMLGGLWLILLPDYALLSGVISGVAWLSSNVLMTFNLWMEWWAELRIAAVGQARAEILHEDLIGLQRATAERMELVVDRCEQHQHRLGLVDTR